MFLGKNFLKIRHWVFAQTSRKIKSFRLCFLFWKKQNMWGDFNWIKIFKAKILSKVENFKSSMSQCSEESALQELGTIWKSFKFLLSNQSESWRIISNKFGFFNLFVYGTLTFTGTSRRRLVEIMRSRKTSFRRSFVS